MLNLSANKKRILVEIIILVIIIVVAGFFIFKIYFQGAQIDEELIMKYQYKELEIEKRFDKLETEIFDNENYQNLEDNKIKRIDINDFEIGKGNPFEIPEEPLEAESQE